MHIAIFFQYYHNPDCAATARHFTFINHWKDRHRVTLITTNAWERQRITNDFPWIPKGVELHSLDVPYHNSMQPFRRLSAFGQYVAGAFAKGLAIDRPDIIFGTSTPLTAAWVAAKVAKWRNVPWVFEVRDLWPDFPIQMGAIKSDLLKRKLYRTEKFLYQSARKIITLSPGMETYVKNKITSTDKVTTIVNGTDFDLIDRSTEQEVTELRKKYGLEEKVVVLYAGTFGRANDIPLILASAERLCSQKKIVFVLAGDGYFSDMVRQKEKSQANLILLPPQPRVEVLKWMKLADLSLVTFIDRPVLKTNSPAKFFDSLGSGTPVVVTNGGWTRSFISDHKCGWHVPSGDVDALSALITELSENPVHLKTAGKCGANVARKRFDRDRFASQAEAILIEAAS